MERQTTTSGMYIKKTYRSKSTDQIPEAEAKSDYSKYNPYLFDPDNFYKHKKNLLFEKWGYNINDAKWLQEEIERQGREKYIAGEYTLGVINHNGQRISIRVSIPRKDSGEEVSFITGWMLYPDGRIKLTTPYGGK